MSSSDEESLGDVREKIEQDESPISPMSLRSKRPSRQRHQVDDEEAEKPIRSNRKSKRSRRMTNDEEASEDEESEGEEEEKPARQRRKPNKRRRTVHDFIQDDVEVDDDDEEEEDADFEEDEFTTNQSERRQAERALLEQESMNRRPSHRDKLAHMSEEEMGRYFEARHAQESYAGRTVNGEMFDSISQNSLLPTTKDPNLWIVKVRMGEEKLTTLQLLRKCIAAANVDDPMYVASIVCKENLKGILYVEARKKANVARLIEGVSSIYSNAIKMVPIGEMVDTLRVIKNLPDLKTDDYVRLKRTMYKGDLAQVDWVDVTQNQVCLRLLPRIDYKKKRGCRRADQNDDNEYQDEELSNFKKSINRKSAKLRLPAAPFDVDKIRELGADTSPDGDFVICEGNRYRRGLLYKVFPLTSVTDEDIHPRLEELKHFQDRPTSNPDFLKELARTKIKEELNVFVVGDVVEVAEGELTNLRGTVQSVEKDGIVIMPEHEELKKPLKFNSSELRKFFKAGDHVRVTGGRYENMTGSVVSVDEREVVIISDLNLDHMKVRPHNVRLDAQVSTGVDQLGQFQFHDLVTLDDNNVGVIIRLERDFVEVLDSQGQVVRVKALSIQPRQVKYAKTFDSLHNTLQAGDRIKFADSTNRTFRDGDDERVGQIKYIFRNSVFVYSRQYTHNSGMFVCNGKTVTLIGANNGPTTNENASDSLVERLKSPRHSLGSGGPGFTSSVHSSTFSQNGRFFGMGGGGARGSRPDLSIIGKTVRIQQGSMKGYLGIAKDATETCVRVELHAQPRTINVDRSRVAIVGDQTSTTRTSSFASSQTFGAIMCPPTPTPMFGGGGRTPMHDSFGGDRTPHYGTTPAYMADAWDPSNVAATPIRSVGHEEEENKFMQTPYAQSKAGHSYTAPETPAGDSMYHDYSGKSSYSRNGFESQAESSSHFPTANSPETIEASDDFIDSGEWCASDLCVRILPTYEDQQVHELEGIIRDVNTNEKSCLVYFEDLEMDAKGADRQIPFEFIKPIQPVEGDRAYVICGNDKGTTGTIGTIDQGMLGMTTENGRHLPKPARNFCKIY